MIRNSYPLRKLKNHPKNIITQIVWSPDGHLLAAGFNSISDVWVWDVEKEEHFYTLQGTGPQATSLMWLSTSLLVVGYMDGTLKVWEVKKEALYNGKDTKSHNKAIYKLILISDTVFVSIGDDRKLCIWGLNDTKFVGNPWGETIFAGDYITTNKGVFVIARGEDVFYCPQGGATPDKIGKQSANATYIACSFDNKEAAVGSEDGSIKLWNLEKERDYKIINEHKTKIIYIKYFNDNKFLLSKSSDGIVNIIDRETKKVRVTYKNQPAREYCVGVAIHPHNSDFIALSDDLNNIVVYNIDLVGLSDSQITINPTPNPIPPQELVDSCIANETVLYAGLGFSAIAGYPIWQTFVSDLLKWSVEKGYIEDDFNLIDPLKSSIEREDSDVADYIASRLPKDILDKRLEEIFVDSKEPTLAHRLVPQILFSAVATHNFDNLLEKVYGDFEPDNDSNKQVYTYNDAESLKNFLSRKEFFILKTYGDVNIPGTPIISAAQYQEILKSNLVLKQFFETLFFSRTVLFIGCSIRGIETIVKELAPSNFKNKKHFALVGVTDNKWRVGAELLNRRYGITVIPYRFDDSKLEITEFLQQLKDKVEIGRSTKSNFLANQPNYLTRLILENIGPFDKLDISLDSKLNILLGDNGVGKTSILKAIAVAICGKDAEKFAGRLIKSGKDSASITLETSHSKPCKIDIYKTSSEAKIESIPDRPLETEGWLALGFSALRFVSSDNPKAPEQNTTVRPMPSDLFPLIESKPDPRTNSLKQWLVNLDYWIKDGKEEYRSLLNKFFSVFSSLTGGLKLEFKEIKAPNYEVIVITDDGEVPIELVSQGTISLLGWIGVILQRLYEIYNKSKDPTQEYAIVLIDEIDAHMHPVWQQSLVHNLTETFPNIQFIATTHSPLIVGGLSPDKVLRFVRNEDGKTKLLDVNDEDVEEMLVGRTDQILTSQLFGLKSTLDFITKKHIKEYEKLLGKENRTSEEEIEYQELRKILRFRVPIPDETPVERVAQEFLQDLLLEQVGTQFEESQKQILAKAEKYLTEVGRRINQKND